MARTAKRKASDDAAASTAGPDTTATTMSSMLTVTIDLAPLKRPVRPPMSEKYSYWSLDQLKLECTARKLNVLKNTKKDDRASILASLPLSS
ncbi:hypothetical protein PPTG_03667 [Phytophthora nicotianae INRA-310]|uniref:Uncharacterized protein n=1 Tax=Phytophthora nicotianae (strain INRA-310) TaxID=761204 RepID=W2R7Q1_PHYN3|nr:hypothetical protein PPTG_03667 [Phytophthora nicotianae INRA-310]ETN20734.1 hypothetical protein PPTG_03667 [Phytophthora nicotianae INRA-310]